VCGSIWGISVNCPRHVFDRFNWRLTCGAHVENVISTTVVLGSEREQPGGDQGHAIDAAEHELYPLEKAEAVRMPGKHFEDLTVGKVFQHTLRRTVTEMDNTLFSALTHNTQPLHIDHEFAAKSEWGKPLVNSLFTLGLLIGVSVEDTTAGTLFANLGMTDVKFPNPLFHGDTVNCTTEIVATRESKSRPNAGIVEFHHKAFKQDGKIVAECKRQALIYRKTGKV
jgi:acyl dehydratase